MTVAIVAVGTFGIFLGVLALLQRRKIRALEQRMQKIGERP